MANIRMEHLCKTYPNGVSAVRDFNLETADKEFLIFVGPSGCGKSTTLRMIAGLEDITSGELCIDGRTMNDVPARNRDIAMVFQSYALYPHMNIYDNIAFGIRRKNLSRTEIDCKVQEAAGILGLKGQLKKKPKELSGGQKQRVAMGAAIVRNPKVFLMDEPLSNLDARLRVQMRLEIAQLYERLGATIVYVTHDQTEAMTLGTRIVVMKDGVIQQVDTPGNLYEHPVNLFVAGFIGSPGMNFLDAEVVNSEQGAVLDVGGTVLSLPKPKQKALAEKGYLGRRITLGLRPQDIVYSQMPANTCSRSSITADIQVYELAGAEAFMYFEYADSKVIACVPSRTKVREGDRVCLAFNMEKAYLFDKDTEEALI